MAEEKSSGLGFKGVILGLILVPGAFVLVWQAAQRARPSDILPRALPVAQIEKAKSDKVPIYITGTVRPRKVSSKPYLEGKDLPFLELGRSNEIYTWYGKKKKTDSTKKKKDKKKKDKKSKKKKKKKDEYKCEKGWVSKVDDKAFDKGCKDKPKNKPSMGSKKTKIALVTIKDVAGKEFAANKEKLQTVGIDSATLNAKDVEKYIVAEQKDSLFRKGDYFYNANSCDESNVKQIGCERIQFNGFMVNPKDIFTIIGSPDLGENSEVSRKQIEAFKDKSGNEYLKICKGTFAACIEGVASQDKKATIWWFVGAALMMFVGLILITDPLTNLIEKIPFIGGFGSGLLKFVFFMTSVITIGLTFVLLKYWYLVLIGFVVLVVALVLMRKKD